MERTKEEIINARGFLKGVAIHYGVDFADELNLLGAALDEVKIIETENKINMEKEKRVLKCVNNEGLETRLTIGRYYSVEFTYLDAQGDIVTYYILDDLGAFSYYSPYYFVASTPRSISTTDPIVEQVKDFFDKRSQVGIKKYGTTLYENNKDNFLDHLREELHDAILYLTKLKNDEEEKEETFVETLGHMMKSSFSSDKYNPAVDYLIDEYENQDLSNDFDRYLTKEKAIRLFKEQIVFAFVTGKYSGEEYKDGKDFYNKNFKQ